MAKILIVDTDEDYGSVLYDWLNHEEHTVELVATGESALELVKSTPFDVIILDWKLVEGFGADIRAAAAAHCQNERTPALILSGHGQTEDRLRRLGCAADHYLVIPFHLASLSTRIRALLGES